MTRVGRRGTTARARRRARSGPVSSGNIQVVLVGPQSAGNIGSVARAMMNTGFRDLVLVDPCEFRNDEGLSMACNATEVLLSARVTGTIDEAVASTPVVVGTTRRVGRSRFPLHTLEEAVPVLLAHAQKNRVSVLFGREDKGLTNREVSLCDILLEIPTDERYPSLNLSHAVLLVLYALFMAGGAGAAPSIKAAPRKELDEMFVHMEEAMKTLGYGKKGGEYLLTAIMRTFRRLFGRTALMEKEVNMLRGIFTRIQERVR